MRATTTGALVVVLAWSAGCYSLRPGTERRDATVGDVGVVDVPTSKDRTANDVSEVTAAIDAPGADVTNGIHDVSDVIDAVDAPDVPPDRGCGATQMYCDEQCVSTQSSVEHCGSCGSACPARPNATAVCATGACGNQCTTGFGDCDGNPANGCEVDLRGSNSDCGACARSCTGGTICSAGLCACPAPLMACAGVCVDLSGDGDNCGSCSNRCTAGFVCAAGVCGLNCTAGLMVCGNDCANFQTDNAHCGACATVCPAPQTCMAGACRCPTGLEFCGARCVDLSSDVANCGGCDMPCATTAGICNNGSCRRTEVYAVRPAVARAGQVVRVEGVFGAGATVTVTFPGSQPIPAMVLGRTRIEAVVPSTATAGNLTVTSGGVPSSNPVAFRSATFGLGVLPFRSRYEQFEYARQTPQLRSARQGAVSINTGTYLYVIGGAQANGTPLATVERALINADGTLGAFNTMPPANNLNTPRAYAALVTLGGRAYVIGGATGATPTSLASVESATLDTNGNLGAFVLEPMITLRAPRSGHVAEVIGDSVYVLAGETLTVERARIGANGALGPFVVTSQSLVNARTRATSAVVGGKLFVLGGRDGSAALDTAEQATIDGDGTLGDFSAVTSRMMVRREGARNVVFGNTVYVVGGVNGATGTPSVESTTLEASGMLSAFTVVPGVTVATPRASPVAAVIGNHLYLLGGGTPMTANATLERASINASGSLSAFSETTVRLETTVNSFGGVFATGGRICLMAGEANASRNGLRCTFVEPGGTLLGFNEYMPTMAGIIPPRTVGGYAIVGNYVYTFGGRSTVDMNEVIRAPIGDGGEVGAFARFGNLDQTRDSMASLVGDGRLFLMGGRNAGIDSPAILASAIDLNGNLEMMFAGPPQMFAASRHRPAVGILGNRVFAISGRDRDGTFHATSFMARLMSDGTLGSFEEMTSPMLLTPRHQAAAVVAGNKLYVLGGRNSTSSLDTIEVATISADGMIGTFGRVVGTYPTDGFALTIGNYVYAIRAGSSGRILRATLE